MTAEDKELLRRQAYRLTMLGLTVERERNKLRKLVEDGLSLDDPRIVQALGCFQTADLEWKALEAEHLRLRQKLGLKT